MNIISLFALIISSIYSFSFQNSEGHTVNMSSFENKNILLVNIASGSKRMSQLVQLQQLQNTYGDSLVVIAFPSNSFGNEPMSDQQIRQFCQTHYGSSFLIASKSPVTGSGKNPIYGWLADQSENGDQNLSIISDFQKVLIGKDGKIKGVFSPQVDPLDPLIINTITSN
jgi:glutathione peroxidase